MDNHNAARIEPHLLDKRSRELIESWQRHAARIKKQHPKWNAEKVQQELKKIIAKQAQKAIPSKPFEDYKEDIEAYYQKISEQREAAIKKIAAHLGAQDSAVIGVAVFELDCGCIRACGVSAEGDPVGEMIMVALGAVKALDDKPLCVKCDADGGADPIRCIRQSMVWPGDESEMPEEEVRLVIGKKVFGDEYSINDI